EKHLLVVVLQFGESAPPRTIGGQRVVGDPGAASVLIEINAGVDGRFHGRLVHTGHGRISAPSQRGKREEKEGFGDFHRKLDCTPVKVVLADRYSAFTRRRRSFARAR